MIQILQVVTMGTKIDWVHINWDMHKELEEKLSKAKNEEEKDPLIWINATAGVATAKYPFDGLTDESALTITTG